MKFACAHFYGITIAVLFDIQNQPLNVMVQCDDALNLGEITQARITQKNNTLKGYFAETEKKAQVFIPSKDSHSIGEEVSVQITKEARLNKVANGIILQQKTDSFCPNINLVLSDSYTAVDDESPLINAHLIEEVLETKIPFADGAYIQLERTNACWTFDVDSAQSTQNISKLNEEACYVIARQILLKNLSGIIEIDFAGIKPVAEQKKLTLLMHHFLFADKRSKMCGFTHAKLCEITRQRTSTSLFDLFLTPNGKKNARFLQIELQEKLSRRFNGRPVLKANPILIKHLPKEFALLCKIVPDMALNEDEYDLKGENDV